MNNNKSKTNHTWWQAISGEEWRKETDRRRHFDTTYNAQEALLANFFDKLNKTRKQTKILDFGAGYGRFFKIATNNHSNITYYGADFNQKMLDEFFNREKINPKNLMVVNNDFQIPVPNKFFDYTFTVSVLIHNNSEDTQKIIEELIRVTKKQIIHIENTFYPSEIKNNEAHNGCWYHDYMNTYKYLGYKKQMYSDLLYPHGLYVIAIQDSTNYFSNKVKFISRKKINKSSIILNEIGDFLANYNDPTLTNLIHPRIVNLKNQINDELSRANQKLNLEVNKLQNKINQLTDSKYFTFYKYYEKLKKIGKDTKNLIKQKKQETFIYQHINGTFKKNKTIGICHRNWHGIRSATINQCSDVILVEKIKTNSEAKLICQYINSLKIDKIAINGLPLGVEKIIDCLINFYPHILVYFIWHGSFTQQTRDIDNIQRLNDFFPYFKKIKKIGFVKKDMEKVFKHYGIQSSYLPNRFTLETSPTKYKINYQQGNRLKIYIPAPMDLRKNNITQIIAANMVKNSETHIACMPKINYLGPTFMKKIINHGFLDLQKYHQLLSNIDITLYVSISECYPMVFLESIYHGKPCLISKTSEFLLGNNEKLKKYLLINNFEDIYEIKYKIEKIRKNYKNISKMCLEYMSTTNTNNEKKIIKFFNGHHTN